MPTDLSPALREAVEVMAEALNDTIRPGEFTCRDLATAALRALIEAGWGLSPPEPFKDGTYCFG
jgi:Xaa-Pro aminopeptidase